MENSNINFFKRIFKSISDFDFYKIVKNETLGKAFKYLILFSILIAIITSINTVILINNGVNSIVSQFETKIPYFEFKNGELYAEGEMPIITEDNGYIMVIDTTNQTSEDILDDYDRGIYVNSYKMVNKKNIAQKDTIEFSQFKELSFSKYDIQKYIPYLKYVSIFIVFFIIIGIILGKLLSTLIISVIAIIVNAITKAKLEYGDLYKLAIYSITLPSIIKLILNLTPYKIPKFFLLYYAIVIFYLVKSITINKDNNIDTLLDDKI